MFVWDMEITRSEQSGRPGGAVVLEGHAVLRMRASPLMGIPFACEKATLAK